MPMKSSNTPVLVTGGAGYIGSHLVLELCEHGYDVTVFDNLSTGHKMNVDSRAELIQGDILNEDELEDAFKQSYDAVFHFAALKGAGESMLDPGKYSKVNISGTINIVNQMLKNNIYNIIFSSTAAVYGLPEYVPVDENHPTNPINFYGFTKLEIEKMLNWYGELKGIKYAILRYSNAVGYDPKGRIMTPEKSPQNLLPIVMKAAMGREVMKVYGNDYPTSDGTCIRDYVHISDLAKSHVKAMQYLIDQKNSLTLNLATGLGYSVLDIIQHAREITGEDIKYEITERRPGDPAEFIADSKLAKKMIGWECEYSDIQTIIESMWNIYKKNSHSEKAEQIY